MRKSLSKSCFKLLLGPATWSVNRFLDPLCGDPSPAADVDHEFHVSHIAGRTEPASLVSL